MLGNEIRLVPKISKDAAKFSVGWYFPSSYAVGMAGLGYQLVWWLLEQDPEIFVQRGFEDVEEPCPPSREMLGFTVSWELDFINILGILQKQGVASLVCERAEDEPIVFGGGPVLTANPEPFADLFDVILLGDAEAVVPAFLAAWKEARTQSTRKERLHKLACMQLPGIYIPQFYEHIYESPLGSIVDLQTIDGVLNPVSKQLFTPPKEYIAQSVILTPDTTWGDMFLIELVRSCPQECRFCLASFLTRPFRSANVEAVLSTIESVLPHVKKVGLLGPSVTEHPQFEELAGGLERFPDLRVSVSSVRADTLNEPILNMLKSHGQRSVTIAIESGSERLRTIMKKNLTEQEIVNAVELVDKCGLEALKFYGIVGLPYETQEDLEATVELMTRLKKSHKRLRITFGVSSFVPKAQTPFQWNGRDKDSANKLEYVRKHLSKKGIEVRPESHNWSDIQALISRGDRRLTPCMLRVSQKGGKLGAWKSELRQAKDSPGLEYYAFRDIPQDEMLPWSHLVDETKTVYLKKHNETASLQSV